MREALQYAAPVGSFLEVGAGQGSNLAALQTLGRTFRAVGVDRERSRLREARAERTRIPLAAAEATRLPFGEESFDSVLLSGQLHQAHDRRRVLGEAWRVLRVGGRLSVIEPNPRSPFGGGRGLSPAALREEVKILPGVGLCEWTMAEPVPLGGERGLRDALACRLGRRLLPRAVWGYTCLTLTKGQRLG